MTRARTAAAPPPPANNLLDRAIAFVAPGWGLKRLESRRRIELAMQYRGAEVSRLRYDWSLGLSPTTAPPYELQTLRNRSRDLNRNDPVASGATDTMGVNIVGRGLRPQSRIRAAILGISEEKAQALRRQAEIVWRAWMPFADSANRLNFDELQFLALRKVIEDGEVLALPVMASESWRPISRAIELLEAERLTGSGSAPGTAGTTGVEVGSRGEPVAYWIAPVDYKNQGTSAYQFGAAQREAARDDQGRPRVLHLFRTTRPGQLRGVPFFAPVLTYFKDLADYLEAEVVAARVAACLSVFITKNDPYGAMEAATISREPGTNARIEGIEPGMVRYLNLGESINALDPKRGGETFKSFVEGVLRLIGAALGMPYELLLKDFSKTNYSSARAALLEGRRMFLHWREWLAAKFCQPIWELVLEEAYLRGLFAAPNFYEFQAEYASCIWIGGGWGWVDPVKEVEASKKAIDYGLSTHAEEAAAQGRDWEETFEQLQRERIRADELDLQLPVSGGKLTYIDGGDHAKAEEK